jgi:hypothetical protein
MARGGIFFFPTSLLLTAALLFALPARAEKEAWRHDRPCGERPSAMAPVEIKGCYRAWCTTTELGKLCACVREDPEDTHFTLERANGTRQAWKAPFVPPMGGDAEHFRVDRVGEGRLFFAVMSRQSAGIAVSAWSVWAIDGARLSQPLEVENYGTLSFPTTARGGTSCRLLAARWHSGSEPGRGPGTYIAGRWHAVENGAFVLVRNRPTVYRRYLFGVERARYEAESRNRPLLWYRGATAVTGTSPLTGSLTGR